MAIEELGSISLKIIGKNFEIETTGSMKSIESNLDEIVKLVNSLNEKLITEDITDVEEIPTPEEIATVPSEDIPVFKASRSTMDNILNLFNTDWGKTPRTAAEVAKALEVNAVPDRVESVNVYLRRFVQRNILRRIKKEGLYRYIKIPNEE